LKLPIARFLIILIYITTSINFQVHAKDNILPPVDNWSGKSAELIHKDSDTWQTPAERTQLSDTPSYDETVAYLKRLVASENKFNMLSLGKSPQQRDIWLVVASKEGAKTPQALAANHKPTVFIQAGIHSGEIDGKDAGLMLLRDISKNGKKALLDNVNIVFMPIFNVDGHERSSPFNRVNQRGPKSMGWRTTAQNLNLNRDYSKADTPEMQLLISAINTWQPSLYLDIHVTDGEDYQYDITYGFNGEHADSPNISRWLSNEFEPVINKALADNGHKGGPLVFGYDSKNFKKGIFGWTAGPRFSNGWGDVRHLPTILIENHSLKPYKQRVLGTYVFLEATLLLLNNKADSLAVATQEDVKSRPAKMTLSWDLDTENPELNDFLGKEYTNQTDKLTRINYINWNGKSKAYQDLPTFWQRKAKVVVDVPKAFYLSSEHLTVIERLKNQGIEMEVLANATKLSATEFSAKDPEFGKVPFEGHLTVKAQFAQQAVQVVLPSGSIKVKTDQTLGRLAVALLDPRAPDSYFAWGFFNQMFQRTEYIESYAIVPLANQMLAQDPKLLADFLKAFPPEIAIINEEETSEIKDLFKSKSDEKLRWFYQKSPYYDKRYMKYPVLFVY